MRNSILMTVYNRPVDVLLNCLVSLGRNDLSDSEVLIVNDGSDRRYEMLYESVLLPFMSRHEIPFKWLNYNTLKERPDTANFSGHNNPAAANNYALSEASGEHIAFLSSDCIVPSNIMERMREHSEAMWVPHVMDIGTNQMWLCGERLYPMCWFVGAPSHSIDDFDLEYLNGMAFEDNDWTARVALDTGKVVMDSACVVKHQTHPLVAYQDDDGGVPAGLPRANRYTKISHDYTVGKWGGVPWQLDGYDPLEHCLVANGTLHETEVFLRVKADA